MARQVRYDPELLKFIRQHDITDRLESIVEILGDEAQNILDWASKEARRLHNRHNGDQSNNNNNQSLGETIYNLIGHEAAIRLVVRNHNRGRLTTREEVRQKTGQDVRMPALYHEAGLRHPQEARNLRHNIFHDSFMTLVRKYFPDSEILIPKTGRGLTPDLIIRHHDPDWELAVEYKGYRSLTLLSESEILKAMRYQAKWGSAWLVTTATKTVHGLYQGELDSEVLVREGLQRLRRVLKRRAYTTEQLESRGIARKGVAHLEKHGKERIVCRLVSAQELLDSCKAGTPIRGLAVSSGFEIVNLLRREGLEEAAENMLRVMKIPTQQLYSDRVSSVSLISEPE